MKPLTWKIMLGVYLAALLALVAGVILPRVTPESRSFIYGTAIILGFLGLSLFRYFFRK